MTLHRRWSLAGGYAVPGSPNYSGWYNGQTGLDDYKIGRMSSTDYGVTWSKYVSNPVLSPGGVGTWDHSYIKDPSVQWDGSQYVMYYTGYNGSTFGIGRATSSDGITWTKDASNPVITPSGTGDETNGCYFPNVLYIPTRSPSWLMWYQGFPAGATPVSPNGIVMRFADSTDGVTWTKRGTVLTAGTAGAFDDSGIGTGGVVHDSGTFHVYFAGYRVSTNYFHAGHATCTDPTNSGTYSKTGVLTGFSGDITFGGRTYHSNVIRQLIKISTGWQALLDLWNTTGGQVEACSSVTASSYTSITVPTSIMLALGSGWDSASAENPCAVVVP